MKNTHNPNLTPNARTLRKEMTKEERHLWYDFLKNYPEREDILNGEKRFDSDSAREIFKEMNFLPNTQWGYAPCLCGRKCDVACYRHLKGEI